MLVSYQTHESIFKSRLFFANSILLGLVALLLPVGIEESEAQDFVQPRELESVPQRSEISATANSAASLERPPVSPAQIQMETKSDSEPLPQPPSAPQSILVPKTSAETFTETNSDAEIESDMVRLPSDSSRAIGTFATQNSVIHQPGQAAVPQSTSTMQSGLPPISHNGLRGASTGMTNRIAAPDTVSQTAAPSSTGSFRPPQQATFEDQSRRSFGSRQPEQILENAAQPTFEDNIRQSFDDQANGSVGNLSRSDGQNSIPPVQSDSKSPN